MWWMYSCLNVNYHYNIKGGYTTTINKIEILLYHQYDWDR